MASMANTAAAGEPITAARAPPPSSVTTDLSGRGVYSDAEHGVGGSTKRPRALDLGEAAAAAMKRPKAEGGGVVPCIALPLRFLDPLAPPEAAPVAVVPPPPPVVVTKFKQFWKAGDYEGTAANSTSMSLAGIDHVRVHPKFLHSNATSHKWALGALAELLDNSLDEVCNGATYVNVDMLENQKDGSRMLLIEDNGGGMNPGRLRQCMSLGYSLKRKLANTIGQYGNGFKTSSMRLGADVIVFSRCSQVEEGQSPTQSVGMLSYTFLRDMQKEDIIVPMIDYEKRGEDWNRMEPSSSITWTTNVETIVKWSPYFNEADLLQQFSSMGHQGTRVVIYNLWEDDQGELELDFDVDRHDIQIRGVNRDEKKIQMAQKFPNSRHFLTYRHSLRSYASILYLRLPPGFRMILRGKEIEHHDLENDMMFKEKKTYRPQAEAALKDPNMVAAVTVGFVKDAKDHIDVQGYNVYHKNRLIKPFWRVWNAAGSDGRGVIGVLEANFVEPAHDKQDFERTIVLSRLENRLVGMQKSYWTSNCHKIGYAPRHKKAKNHLGDKESLPETPQLSSRSSKDVSPSNFSCHVGSSQDSVAYQNNKSHTQIKNHDMRETNASATVSTEMEASRSANGLLSSAKGVGKNLDSLSPQSRSDRRFHASGGNDPDTGCNPIKSCTNESDGLGKDFTPRPFTDESASSPLCSPHTMHIGTKKVHALTGIAEIDQTATFLNSKETPVISRESGPSLEGFEMSSTQLSNENRALKLRLEKLQESMSNELQYERDKNKSLSEQLVAAERKFEKLDKEQEALIGIFSEERCRRDTVEAKLRQELKEACTTVQNLLEKLDSNQNYIKREH